MIDKLKNWIGNLFGGKTKVRKVKLTARDIEENCIRIKAKMDKTKIGTAEYETLQKELEHEQVILRKYKDAKWTVQPREWLTIGGTALGFMFLIGLSREWPSALKLGSIILKMFPYKGI